MSQGMDAGAIGKLAERYGGLGQSERRRYNEANTRKDFIDPLFAALGWDMRGVERDDVDVEMHVSGGRADYAFKIDGVVRFYLEAKRLEEDLYNPEYAKQVMTYAYNKGVPWAVLCNFARLQVFNAEWETDDLNRARFLDLAWEGYTHADSPLRLLSREALLSGDLDSRAQTYGGMRPRLPVEKSLYAQMRHWRERLFNDIARMRPELTFEQVDEVIERLLNRLIFIRNCEDRRVDEPMLRAAVHQWRQAGRRAGLTEAVHGIFGHFDATFDSDLFALHLVDQLLASGTEFEDTLGDIVTGLYAPPRSLAAYDFSVIDGDVLGQVYEQYLGHVAQVVKEVAAKRESQLALGIEVPRIQLEAKRQRRKERGIYYTPKWVVDYIVRQTVGRYLEEHTYNDVLNVKILDPACGSGSFLIRAFDVLLEHHGRVRSKAAGELDQYERLPVLTANIFGVDLDQRAVDFARLNLLLRAVARRELLPSLERNIMRGNSLISGSEEELRAYFGDTWEEKHPFDWKREFRGIMERGGFDIIIGNPPYVQLSMEGLGDEHVRRYLRATYGLSMGRLNTFGFFISRGLQLLKSGGLLGFILPNTLLTQEYYSELRKLILEQSYIISLATLSAMPFEAAVVENILIVLRKRATEDRRDSLVTICHPGANQPDSRVPQSVFTTTYKYAFTPRFSPALQQVRSRMECSSQILGDLVNINQAIALKRDRAASLFREARGSEYKRVLDGRDIDTYSIRWPGTYLLYDRDKIHSCKREDIFLVAEKVLFRRVGERIIAALDDQQFYALNTLVVVTAKDPTTSLRVVLALMNSKTLNWYYTTFLKSTKRVFSEIQARQVAQLPIRLPPWGTSLHDDVVALVGRMLALHERLAAKGDVQDEERARIERDITHTDREIDELVYDLYGLTRAERRLVEEEVGR